MPAIFQGLKGARGSNSSHKLISVPKSSQNYTVQLAALMLQVALYGALQWAHVT